MHGLEKAIAGSDIVVVPQELECLTVPYLWAKRKQICNSWIWWGHGYNFQAPARPSVGAYFKKALKRFMTRRADGLITYRGLGHIPPHSPNKPRLQGCFVSDQNYRRSAIEPCEGTSLARLKRIVVGWSYGKLAAFDQQP